MQTLKSIRSLVLHLFTLWWCSIALWWRGVVATDPLLLMGGHLVADVAGQCLLGLSLPCPHTVRHLSEVPQRLLTVFAVHQLKGEDSNNKSIVLMFVGVGGGRMNGSGEMVRQMLAPSCPPLCL